ncbi:MAG: hypothetical protein WCC87_03060 [Candidatus Korobacteraceae bacterium]
MQAGTFAIKSLSEGATATNTKKPALQIRPHMSLEQAMAEVRRYLEASGSLARPASAAGAAAPGQARQFTLLGSSIARLSRVSATYGEIAADGKGGAFGSYLKRIIRKAIGWYSRPVYEFDRTVIEAFEQTRLDMLGLQQQISTVASDGRQMEQAELLRSMIELLFANIATVQALRQAVQSERPDFQQKFEELLKSSEAELADIKSALLEQLPPALDK